MSLFGRNRSPDRVVSHKYSGHDDRFHNDYSSDNRRGGRGRNGQNYRGRGGGGRHSSRKMGHNKRGQRGRSPYGSNQSADPRSRLATDDDGDSMMQKSPSSRRHAPYQRDRPRGHGRQRQFNSGGRTSSSYTNPNEAWYKVVIPYGRKATKDYVLRSINNMSTQPVMAKNYHNVQEKAIFFIQGKDSADAIRSLSRQIKMPNGFKMVINVFESAAPKNNLTSQELEKLKIVMSNRYDSALKVLNLANLFNDAELNKDGLYFSFNKKVIATEVQNIIKEHIPELEALDLSENNLYDLSSFEDIESKAPNIKCIHLKKNKIRYESDLRILAKLKIEELHLEGNPLCDKFKEDRAYVIAIRKIFPNVLKLDGHTLPPPIKFELESTASLPESKGSYFTNAEVKNLITLFLKQYLEIFDGDNRQLLMEAYHDSAQFSFSHFDNSLLRQQKHFNAYTDSRNLQKVRINHKREKALKSGKLNIVSYLSQFPSTQHDLSTLVIDVNCQNDKLLSFTVTGVYKETTNKSDLPPIRAFSRVFLTVPQGQGIVVLNEQFTVTNATQNQVKKSFINPAPTPSSSPVLGNSGLVLDTLSAGSTVTDKQSEMIVQFSAISNMNNEWSAKCLAQNDWNFEKAGQVFTDLQSKGSIPQEAFIK